ncbi:MAG TPA: hypothetical protein VII52_09100 [Gemmatimonadaceae bacterium]
MRLLGALLIAPAVLAAQTSDAATLSEIDRRTAAVLPSVVEWRRDIHQHPELSFQETRVGAKNVVERSERDLCNCNGQYSKS